MLQAVLLLRQPLDPPDIGKKLTNLLRYVLAILLGQSPPVLWLRSAANTNKYAAA
jgi:hypothetical protein